MLFSRKSVGRRSPEPKLSIVPEHLPLAAERSGTARPGGALPQSFLDARLTITGDLHSNGDVRVDGRICGNVSCAQLIVGKEAVITGAVRAEQTIVRGTITGTIRSPVVILQATARVESEITYTLLAIDDGARFEGAARHSERPLEEPEAVSALAELKRMLPLESATAATGSNGHDTSSEQGPVSSQPMPGHRAANGCAEKADRPTDTDA